jgi:hypothetical protein
MTRSLVSLAVVALLLAGCGGQPGSAARPSSAPASAAPSAPASTPSGAPQPSIDRCHTTGLAVAEVGTANGVAGNFYQELGLTNRLSSACTLYGYVGMALLDAGGSQLPTHVVRDQGGRFPFAHLTQFTVQPGATAPFWVHWEQVPVGGETTCPTSAGLVVTPPDETTQLRLNGIRIMACNAGELDVSPVTAPGTTGP